MGGAIIYHHGIMFKLTDYILTDSRTESYIFAGFARCIKDTVKLLLLSLQVNYHAYDIYIV